MDGKCKICKEDALCYSSEDKGEKVYRFFCLNEVCDNHNPYPESISMNLSEIPEWFRWKTLKDKLFDNRLKIFLCVAHFTFLLLFCIWYSTKNQNIKSFYVMS